MKKIFFIIPLLFINLSFNCINLYNNKTLIKKLRKESKGFIDDLYKCNCIAQLVDLNEKIIAE